MGLLLVVRNLIQWSAAAMEENGLKQRLVGIMVADAVGYSRLMALDEYATVAALDAARAVFKEHIEVNQGRVIDMAGDSVLAIFETAAGAVKCAVATQEDLKSSVNAIPENRRMQFRIGIHLGDVIEKPDGTVYGDGVNIAARLESLSEPGEVIVSDMVFGAVRDRTAVLFEDAGEHQVKNIARAVHAYRTGTPNGHHPVIDASLSGDVTVGNSASQKSDNGTDMNRANQKTVAKKDRGNQKTTSKSKRLWVAGTALLVLTIGGLTLMQLAKPNIEPANPAKMALALPTKPSIVVLPFRNSSGNKEQDYFSDGITEDIITDLSKVSGLFVIGRNSAFKYKDQTIVIRQVAEDLGVRYVLQGSIRRTADGLRITAELNDAIKGQQVWANRYDRDINELFAVQSDVTRKVVKDMAVTLKASEQERLYRPHTTSIDAYETFLRARNTVMTPSKRNIEFAEQLFNRTIELDKDFAGGYAGLSLNHSVKARFRYGDSPLLDLQRSLELGKKAIQVDKDFAWSYIALGGAYLANGDPDAAVDSVLQALLLQPNGYEENLWMGFYSHFAGQSSLAVEHLERANRISPTDTGRKLSFMAMARFMNGDYEESVTLMEKRMRLYPVGTPNPHIYLAAALVLLNRVDESAAVVTKFRELNPNFHLAKYRFIDSYKSPENRKRLYDAAKRAGIPE